MERKGILFVISGPSGVGKGTLREKLLLMENNLIYSISATTRKARPGEVDGRDYLFTDIERFQEMIDKGELLEWAKVYNNYYGTPRSFVQENLDKGLDVLLEIDIQGALQVKKSFPEGAFIFIMPPSLEALAERLAKRGQDAAEDIERRLACYDEEIKHIWDYDYMVVNDDINPAVSRLNAIIEAERCRIIRFTRGD
ncbi:MAG: guanylate kinase [Candidatus Saccharibacteria bacterium]